MASSTPPQATGDATATAAAEAATRTVHVGTRSSKLAMLQAEAVVAALRRANPSVQFVIDAREPAGDRDKTTPLTLMGKGLWTSEFEAQLLAGELDLVVHCVKDMPTTLPVGCALGAITDREDPRDAVVFAAGSSTAGGYRTIQDLPAGSVVGTSSVRRSAQLRRRFPGLVFENLRGNVDTRLRKLDAPAAGAPRYDCIILAAAGLKRMGLGGRIAQALDAASAGTLYAVGQGALAIEIRTGDADTQALLAGIVDAPTELACLAERAVMRALEGGCSVPIGVESTWLGDGTTTTTPRQLRLAATVVSLDGQQAVDGERTAEVATAEQADALGRQVAQAMIDDGAQAILDAINKTRAPGTAASS